MRKIPFLRICLALVLGILVNPLITGFLMLKIFFTIFLSACTIVVYLKSLKNHNCILSFGIFLLATIFSLGLFLDEVNQIENQNCHFTNYSINEECAFYGEINSVKPTKKGTQCIVSVKSIARDSVNVNTCGKIQVYIPTKDSIKVNQLIHFTATPIEFQKNVNAYAFDYKSFMARKYVFHQCFANSFHIIDTPLYRLNEVKNAINTSIASLQVGSESKSLIKAMLLGDKSGLNELKEIFRSTGTSHVLAISGLHVGIIAAIFNFLLFGIPDKYRLLKNSIIIFGVWIFCILSGMSASTVRASIMVSSYLVGLSFRLKGFGFNFCFLSGFFMLIVDPNQIYDIGFQFSYLAILGILFFYEPIYKILIFKGLKDVLWQMSVLSFSAQLTLLPLSLYYFHEFPLLFIPASIIAIPATFIIIAFALFTLIVNSFYNSIFLSELLDWFVQFFVKLLSIFSNIDGAVLTQLCPSIGEVLIYYLILICISAYCMCNKLVFLKISVALLIVMLMFSTFYNKDIYGNNLVIYGDEKQILIDVISNGNTLSFTEAGTKEYTSNSARQGIYTKYGVHNINESTIPKDHNLIISIGETKLLILNDTSQEFTNQNFDYVLLNTPLAKEATFTPSTAYIDFADNNHITNKKLIRNQQIIKFLN